jgi:hypothetical protein
VAKHKTLGLDRQSADEYILQVASADKAFSQAKSEAEAFGKGVKADAIKKIDEIDRKVEDSASKAKSGISSWFGGK